MPLLADAVSQPPAPVPTERRRAEAERRPVRLAALRAPLIVKLVGAHLLVLVSLCLFAARTPAGGWSRSQLLAAGLTGAIVYTILVVVALHPVRDLELAASRVWGGDYAARVDASLVADRDVLRVGAMFNLLLDGLVADRARMRRLAGEVIRAGDRERATLARELHDSTAQRLAAVLLQLGSASRDATDPAIKAQFLALREEVHGAMEEVRTLSFTVHPRVLDDLGLAAALQQLGREVGHHAGLQVDVSVTQTATLPSSQASVLYRVAQEGLHNVVRHAEATRVDVTLKVKDDIATLRIHDDGHGFDLAAAERRHEGMGLFTIRERIELVDGTFSIRSGSAEGTTIVATIPVTAAGIPHLPSHTREPIS